MSAPSYHLSPTSDSKTLSSNDHSTLEVAHGRDYDKEAVPRPYVAGEHLSGAVWAGAVPEGARILGFNRRTFFILAWIASIIVAVAAGVGGSLGATMGKRTCDVAAADNTNTAPFPGAITNPTRSPTPGVSGPSSESSPGSGIPSESAVPTLTTTKPPSSATTSSSATTTNTASVRIGGIGGRCSNQWGGDCICLDEGVCRNKWKGTPYTGTPDNWPCPKDPNNIMACIVKPCLGKVGPTQCLWKEACNQTNPATDSAPICPGEGDFICCAHSW